MKVTVQIGQLVHGNGAPQPPDHMADLIGASLERRIAGSAPTGHLTPDDALADSIASAIHRLLEDQ